MGTSLVLGDWGSSRLRLWLLEDGEVVDRRKGKGIAKATNAAETLVRTLGDWSPKRIILCGMVGSRNGLHEVPYVECPASIDDWIASSPRIALHDTQLRIAAGVAYRGAGGRPDVMRGEETQIYGAINLEPALGTGEHLLLLPGTHCKWVQVEDGRIKSFRTFMSGELFDLLQHSSLLAAEAPEGNDIQDGFLAGIDRSGPLSATLFEARCTQLVDGRSASWARGFVSGLLVGAEIQEMVPQGMVTIVSEAEHADRYARALAHSGIKARRFDDEECAIAGLRTLDDN